MPFGIGEGYGLGSLGMGIYNMFNKQPNPANAATPYLNKIPQYANQAYSPYVNAGKSMMPGMNELYTQMMQDPTAFFNKIGSGYKESPGYQKSMHDAMQAIENSQAAGGMAGSMQHQRLSSETASDLASKDFQQYINNILGIQGSGMQGGENAVNRGYNASTGWLDAMGGNANQMANYAFTGQAGQNAQNSQNWANVFGGASMLMPWLFGGGNQ